MSWCYDVRGPSYHWVIDLFEGLNLPVIPAGVEALQKDVAEHMKEVQRGKTDHKKKVRIQMKVARGEEQEARKKWVKRQAVQHTYGQEEELGEENEAEDPALIEAAREHSGELRRALETLCTSVDEVVAVAQNNTSERHTLLVHSTPKITVIRKLHTSTLTDHVAKS